MSFGACWDTHVSLSSRDAFSTVRRVPPDGNLEVGVGVADGHDRADDGGCARKRAGRSERLVLRDLLSLHQRGGRIGAKVCHRADPQIEVRQGNHELGGSRLGMRWSASPITVLHVPDRSYAQFAHKIEIGGRSLAANPLLAHTFGWHWRAHYERLQKGTLERTWRNRQLDDAAVSAGLVGGRLVRDDRLVRRLRDLRAGALLRDQVEAVLSRDSES